MEADSPRARALVKMDCDSLCDLLLQIAKIFPLSRDAAFGIWIVPPRYEPPGFLVAPDLQSDFVHEIEPLLSIL